MFSGVRGDPWSTKPRLLKRGFLIFHENSLLHRSCNPTYRRHYLGAIQTLIRRQLLAKSHSIPT